MTPPALSSRWKRAAAESCVSRRRMKGTKWKVLFNKIYREISSFYTCKKSTSVVLSVLS